MWAKFSQWVTSEDSNWFFIGYFLCDFFDLLLRGEHNTALVALALILGNIWLLNRK